MEAHAAAVLAEYGADPAGFTGRELLDDHVIDADLVLTATLDHRAQVISMGHAAGLRTFTLKEFTRLVAGHRPGDAPRGRASSERGPRAGPGRRRAARLAAGARSPRRTRSTTRTAPRSAFFRSIGEEIHAALDPVVTALTGIPAAV